MNTNKNKCFLQKKWEQLTAPYITSITLKNTVALHFTNLWTAYNNSSRFYHNETHLVHIFSVLEEFNSLFTNENVVIWAVFFHDSIYDTQKQDNEQQSALYAQNVMQELGCSVVDIKLVESIILATQNHQTESQLPEYLYFLDADLSILGSSSDVYKQYSQAIRAEYAWVPMPLYNKSRQKVLQNFLNKPQLYFTDVLRQRYEKQARLNIAAEIDFLKKN